MVNGYIPFLKCRDIITDWAKLFIADNILPYIPVAVQIRINEDIQPIRNSNLDAWYKFFKYCQTKYKVKFLILCSFKEYELIINHFKDLQNIVFLKEYNTKIEQDLAIIQESSMYMGGASGPSTIAWFNDKPYVVFNPVGSGAQKVKKTKRLVFGGKYQHQVWEKETFELLKNEFTILFKSIDTTYYINNVTILKTGDKLGSKFSLV